MTTDADPEPSSPAAADAAGYLGPAGTRRASAPAGTPPATNWFAEGGHDYARFRPAYPPELARVLADIAPAHRLALDVGCGSGQLTTLLGAHFDTVVGLDPSADQLTHALPRAGVHYARAAAEHLPLVDRSAELITAAQAAHWFDLPAFHAEVRRVGVPGAVVALASYGVLELEPPVRERFVKFYREEIGPYWPPERRLVESGYATLDFPFAERPSPRLQIRRDWDLRSLLGYVSTWSAVRRAAADGRTDLLDGFADDLAAAWGDPRTARAVVWPIRLRLGVV